MLKQLIVAWARKQLLKQLSERSAWQGPLSTAPAGVDYARIRTGYDFRMEGRDIELDIVFRLGDRPG